MRLIIIFILFQFSMTSAQEIQNNIFGFATSNTFTYCDVADSSFTNKVAAINPQVLRFPGGALGNFYHFGKSGYGFNLNEIEKYHGGKFPKRSIGLEKYRMKNKHDHDYIDDFILLVKKTNSRVVLVANPFVDEDIDIILMIQKLKDNNIEVIGVELGSELSNRSYFIRGYSIDDYIIFAERCSKNIKSNFPDLKTAVIAAPLGKRKGHRHNIWNSKLSMINFYDAIIIHSYAKVIKGKSLDGQMISEKIDLDNKAEEFEIYKKRAIDFLHISYPLEVQEYVNIYNKPIWVTEWNLQMSQTTGNTLLQSLFVAQYFLEVFSNPNLSSIELTTYHNLGGRDLSGSIFRNNKGKLEIQSTYYPMIMVGKIFENKIVRIEAQKNNNIFTYQCYDKYNNAVLNYSLDWDSYELKCSYNIIGSATKNSIVYKSYNLFDKADSLGILDLKIDKFRE